MWRELVRLPMEGSAEGLWNALQIWLNKPHVVNRRLCGTQNLVEEHVLTQRKDVHFPDPDTYSAIKKSFVETKDVHETVIGLFSGGPDSPVHRKRTADGEVVDVTKSHQVDEKYMEVIVRDLIPKQIDKCPVLRELVILGMAVSIIFFLQFISL